MFKVFLLLFVLVNIVAADLRSWALGFGKSSSGGVAIPAPNSANTSGKEYKTCWVNGMNAHGNTHAALKFAPECATNGYWRMDYNTAWGTCIMFGDVSVSGCPFANSFTNEAEVVSKNQGDKGGEWTDPKYGITFVNCSKGSRVELHRSENTYCNNPSNCKTLTSGSILSFLCPS